MTKTMKPFHACALALAALLSLSLLTPAHADPLADRMKSRVGQVDNLLTTEKAGEGNDGYLVALKSLSSSERSVLNAENRDRRELYKRIASTAGLPVEQVGELRAKDIRRKAKGGILVQTPEGTWMRK